jgi:hypothetical protein
MSKRNEMETLQFSDAQELSHILADVNGRGVYVEAPDGTIYTRATIVRDVLSDGSEAYSVVLG